MLVVATTTHSEQIKSRFICHIRSRISLVGLLFTGMIEVADGGFHVLTPPPLQVPVPRAPVRTRVNVRPSPAPDGETSLMDTSAGASRDSRESTARSVSTGSFIIPASTCNNQDVDLITCLCSMLGHVWLCEEQQWGKIFRALYYPPLGLL